MLAQLCDLERRIGNMIAAIESGGDARPLMDQLAQRTAEREALKVQVAAATGSSTLTVKQIDSLLGALGGISQILRDATPKERAAAYYTLGLRMVYDDRTHQVGVTADLARVAAGVGGGTLPPATRETVLDLVA
jgi:hypothetical protein